MSYEKEFREQVKKLKAKKFKGSAESFTNGEKSTFEDAERRTFDAIVAGGFTKKQAKVLMVLVEGLCVTLLADVERMLSESVVLLKPGDSNN